MRLAFQRGRLGFVLLQDRVAQRTLIHILLVGLGLVARLLGLLRRVVWDIGFGLNRFILRGRRLGAGLGRLREGRGAPDQEPQQRQRYRQGR
ncbi:hypothetical protein GCM10011487_60400 [Steroidobacter agaridevorans]|uniref:Uncharacterized protein n=1 Tax=Steroidobacter agaridevorans TaxID=2695856 RepID=A0A829YLC2_9GAMM|nr:hypothetical protein GCM10011487_60400 [Steroidobacter agaridevorans]GFE91491.1 hypothetical protein GCM10011488_64450 [Steroidobacter agaridevorans]